MTIQNNNEERSLMDSKPFADEYVAPKATLCLFDMTSNLMDSAPFGGRGGDDGGNLDNIFSQDE